MKSNTERRRGPRKRSDGKVSVRQLVRHTMAGETLVDAAVLNLSNRGILCRVNPPTEIHSEVELVLDVTAEDGQHQISCQGIVMRCHPAGGGYDTAISITDFSGTDNTTYLEVVEALPPV